MKLTSLNQLPEQTVSHNRAIKKKVMLNTGDLPHLTNFSQATFSPGQVASGHFHQDMCEVFFVEAGEGIIKIDGKTYPLEKGSCVAVEPGEVHEIVNNGSSDLILTYFGIKVER
ncbi:cupin domain-containing protein [Candidatus Gracilibacteria bacterium]|nr:cupin domain-containing protein [Candidatus Gracilibacteria bacterium]NJM89650.1 cupin domain-containing protein [Hydrococcus sp. RU_2_2]